MTACLPSIHDTTARTHRTETYLNDSVLHTKNKNTTINESLSNWWDSPTMHFYISKWRVFRLSSELFVFRACVNTTCKLWSPRLIQTMWIFCLQVKCQHTDRPTTPQLRSLPPPSIACPLQQIPSFLCMSVPHALCLRIPAYAEICRNKQLFISTDSCIFYSCINLRISTDSYRFPRIPADFY